MTRIRDRIVAFASLLRPSSFRAKVTLAVACSIIVMMSALIITQNIVVARTTAQQNELMTMCLSPDGTVSVTVNNKDKSSQQDSVPSVSSIFSDTATNSNVCYSSTRGNLDGATIFAPETTNDWQSDTTTAGSSTSEPVIANENSNLITSTANAVTDTLTTTMRTVSIITLTIFGLIAIGAAWFIGTMLSRRVTAVDRQVAALQPNDLSARIDVTPGHDDIDRLVDSINTMLDRIQASSEAERRFVANASHELRTPIAAVATNLDAPLAQGRFPKDVEPSVRRALAANQRGAQLVQALLTLSRIQSGTIGAHTPPTETSSHMLPETSPASSPDTKQTVETMTEPTADLASCITNAVGTIADDAHKHNITINLDDLPEATVAVDPVLLDLAVSNLIRNAVVHNTDNGVINITITSATPVNNTNQDHGSTHSHVDTHSTFTVTNTTSEELPDDFNELKQPFHRGTQSRISTISGVGLGLSIAAAACEAMQATLALSRTEDGLFCASIRF